MTFLRPSLRARASPVVTLHKYLPPRVAVWFVAVSFVSLTPPRALNSFRLIHIALPLALLGIHFAFRYAKGGVGAVRIPVVLSVFVIWCALTAFWSVAKFNTLFETVVTIVLLFLGATLGSLCSLRDIVRGVMLGGFIILAASIIVAVAVPSYGLMPAGYQGGALRGIYGHRNLLAEALTLPIVASLSSEFVGKAPRMKRICSTGVLFGGLLLTRSSTALATDLAVVALFVLIAWIRNTRTRWRLVPMVGSIVVIAAALVIVVSNMTQVFALLGRDDTLTGRTPIWMAVGTLISRSPMQGTGWGAAWDVSSPVEQYVSLTAGFFVPSAHNGYLDLVLQAGAVGATLFLGAVTLMVIRGLAMVRVSGSPLAAWPPLAGTAILLYSVGESSLISPVVIMIFAAIMSHKGGASSAEADDFHDVEPTRVSKSPSGRLSRSILTR